MRITGVELNMAEDVFKLAHLLGANLLATREEACHLPSSHRHLAAEALCQFACSLEPGSQLSSLQGGVTSTQLAGAPQIEELAAAAVKEESIEAKLAALTAQWAVLSLTFQDYKTRGPVILKVQHVCMCGMVPETELLEHAKPGCACLHGRITPMELYMQNASWVKFAW